MNEVNSKLPHEEQGDSPLHLHLIGGWRLKALILTVIMSVIGYFLFTLWAGWQGVAQAISQVGFLGITLALCLSLFNYFLRFLRWQLFLKVLGHSIPWLPSFQIFMSGFSLTTTPGKTGEAIKGIFLKDYGVPFRKSFGAFLSERTSDLLSVAILAAGGLWIHPESRPILLVVIAILILFLIAVQRDSWLYALERLAKKVLPVRFAHVAEFVLDTIMSFRNCFSLPILLAGIFLGVTAWTAEAVALYSLLHFLHYDIDLITAIFIYGFSLVIGGITLLPGGLGGAEITMLQLLMMQEIPASVAVAVTLVIRLTSLWFSVFLGLIALPKKHILWQGAKSSSSESHGEK